MKREWRRRLIGIRIEYGRASALFLLLDSQAQGKIVVVDYGGHCMVAGGISRYILGKGSLRVSRYYEERCACRRLW